MNAPGKYKSSLNKFEKKKKRFKLQKPWTKSEMPVILNPLHMNGNIDNICQEERQSRYFYLRYF